MALAGQLWVKLVDRGRTSRDAVAPCPSGDWQEALREACRELDLSVPIIVPKHLRDWENSRQARFLPEHFMDGLPHDRLEIEYFDPDAEAPARGSRDPRNG